MAYQRRLPDVSVLISLVDQGLTNQQIGERYGTSAEAVRQALARNGVRRGPARPNHSRFIPWRLRADHVGDVLARRLRAYSKMQQGKQLSSTEQRLLDEWMRFMDGDNSHGIPLSVHYDRMDEAGFWLEPRQPGDRDYISPPLEEAASAGM